MPEVRSARSRSLGEKGEGCAPEVVTVAVLGQHVTAAALEVQQAAIERAVMGVSEGHAGSRSGQTAGAAAAGTQGRSLILASDPNTVSHSIRPSL